MKRVRRNDDDDRIARGGGELAGNNIEILFTCDRRIFPHKGQVVGRGAADRYSVYEHEHVNRSRKRDICSKRLFIAIYDNRWDIFECVSRFPPSE